MKNIPRIFVGDDVASGMIIPAARDVMHYLSRVMRRRDCLVFGAGREFTARLSDDGKSLVVGAQTPHVDPSGVAHLYFAPIKRTDDLVNMATQMGAAALHPVITDRTDVSHINWQRMEKIAIQAAEQSNRNSVPKIFPPVRFSELDLSGIAFADERAAHGRDIASSCIDVTGVLVGPEGGFSDAEFNALDAAGARPISLAKTILRAELAAAIALDKIME